MLVQNGIFKTKQPYLKLGRFHFVEEISMIFGFKKHASLRKNCRKYFAPRAVTRVSQIKTTAKLVVAVALTAAATSSSAFCFEEAAERHGVNAFMLNVIASHESRLNERSVVQNSNGSADLGLMGINSVHLDDLKVFGIGREQLMDACVNVNVGAWLLAKKIKKYGNTWQAYGAYHSENQPYSNIYQGKIYREALSLQSKFFAKDNSAR